MKIIIINNKQNKAMKIYSGTPIKINAKQMCREIERVSDFREERNVHTIEWVVIHSNAFHVKQKYTTNSNQGDPFLHGTCTQFDWIKTFVPHLTTLDPSIHSFNSQIEFNIPKPKLRCCDVCCSVCNPNSPLYGHCIALVVSCSSSVSEWKISTVVASHSGVLHTRHSRDQKKNYAKLILIHTQKKKRRKKQNQWLKQSFRYTRLQRCMSKWKKIKSTLKHQIKI